MEIGIHTETAEKAGDLQTREMRIDMGLMGRFTQIYVRRISSRTLYPLEEHVLESVRKVFGAYYNIDLKKQGLAFSKDSLGNEITDLKSAREKYNEALREDPDSLIEEVTAFHNIDDPYVYYENGDSVNRDFDMDEFWMKIRFKENFTKNLLVRLLQEET